MEHGYSMASFWGMAPIGFSRLGRDQNGRDMQSPISVEADRSREKCPLVDQELMRVDTSDTQVLLGDEEDHQKPPIAWFWPALCAFFLFCPLGYAAIISVFQAQEAYENGDRKMTERLRSNAKVFIVLSLIMFLFVITIVLFKVCHYI